MNVCICVYVCVLARAKHVHMCIMCVYMCVSCVYVCQMCVFV